MEKHAFPFKAGDYVVFDHIGKGGMAEIFLARYVGPLSEGKTVVLKKIHSYLAQIPQFVKALMNEARIMDRINSPFVTKIVDLKAEGEDAYIAMEYVEGVDLNRLLGLFSRHRIPVPETFIFHVVSSILQGLAAVHRSRGPDGKLLNLIHLDLSPGNILVSFSGEVKICDFGVATTSELTQIMFQEGEIRGKLSYMSPEQAAGRPLDSRSDIFSTGIIMWELLAGKKMYFSKDKNEVHRMALTGDYPPLEEGRYRDQHVLEEIVSRALAREPDERYRDALQFHDDLMDYIQQRRLVLSQIAIGQMLERQFSEEILQVRYERERILSTILPPEKELG